jgi:predicted Zn-dependent protease
MDTSKEKLYKEFLQDNPDDPLVHFSLGTLYLDADRLEAAIEELETTVRLKPDYMAAFWKLANAYEENNDIDKAVQAYHQTLALAQQEDDSTMIEDVQDRLGSLES